MNEQLTVALIYIITTALFYHDSCQNMKDEEKGDFVKKIKMIRNYSIPLALVLYSMVISPEAINGHGSLACILLSAFGLYKFNSYLKSQIDDDE